MVEFEVRAGREGDADAVRRLGLEWQREGATLGHVADSVAAYVTAIRGLSGIAEANGAPIGYFTASLHAEHLAVMPRGARYVELDELYVVAGWRRRGVGSALLDFLKQRAGETGVGHLHVFSASRDLESALAFYRRHGFEPWAFQAIAEI